MIEIVFGDSACGSLKLAQSFGGGPYREGCIGVIVSHSDGTNPTEAEIAQACREAEERERLAWENAVPIGGKTSDVYGFSLALSIGEIVDAPVGEKRRQTLERLFSIYPEEGQPDAGEILERVTESLQSVRDRAAAGEEIRIWYSSQPDEMCGLYWMMSQLSQWGIEKSVYMVRLPEWDSDCSGRAIRKNSWGDVAPGEWHRYLALQQPMSVEWRDYCASHWQTLQSENAPLRAVLNGRLVSTPETLYDSFICQEIGEEGEHFQEASVVGRVLGKYQLGVGDSWVALRIEEMIQSGMLEILTDHTREDPVYHRILGKRNFGKAAQTSANAVQR